WESGSGPVQGDPDRAIPSPSVRVSRRSVGLATRPTALPFLPLPQVPCTDVDRPHAPPASLLTVRDVAGLLRVSTKTIYALAARQELPQGGPGCLSPRSSRPP